MEKLEPPSYEETNAVGPSQHTSITNMPYIPNEVFQHAPTAPTIGLIESSITPHAPSAPTIGTIESVNAPLLNLDPLSDVDLRSALYQHKSDLGCSASMFIRGVIFTDIQNDCAFHYKLESFGEKRECTPRFTGYYGQSIDGPENGAAPDKWNVHIGMPIKFVDHQITTEIPHTAYVKECSTCEGEKKIDCTTCGARGKIDCRRCDGSGKNDENVECRICKGSGTKECSKCTGIGTIDCSFCEGYGQVKYYMLLIVTWKNHVDDIVSNRHNFPEKLILEASGQDIFTKQANQVEPLNTGHVTLNEASAVLIEKHHSSIRNEAIRAQVMFMEINHLIFSFNIALIFLLTNYLILHIILNPKGNNKEHN